MAKKQAELDIATKIDYDGTISRVGNTADAFNSAYGIEKWKKYSIQFLSDFSRKQDSFGNGEWQHAMFNIDIQKGTIITWLPKKNTKFVKLEFSTSSEVYQTRNNFGKHSKTRTLREESTGSKISVDTCEKEFRAKLISREKRVVKIPTLMFWFILSEAKVSITDEQWKVIETVKKEVSEITDEEVKKKKK